MAGSVEVGRGHVTISTEESQLDRGLASARKSVTSWLGNITQGIAQGIGQALANAIGNGIRAGFAGVASSIKLASDLNETIAKTSAVFRDSSRDILDWSKTTSTAFGLTQQEALNAASGLGNMFKQLGGGTSDAATFSKDLITLAGDLTAFHNVAGGTSEVLDDMASAFRGEFDPIQKYIPVINAAVVEQRALADTGKDTAKQLTALDKAMAVQTLIVQGMGDAYGSAAREIDSAASQQRIFDARITESAARLGQVFLPVQQAFFKGLNLLIDTVAPYGEGIMDSLAAGLARGITSILPVLAQVRALFVYWLKPGSPPRLLSELTDWGRSAMDEYLRGWTQADFGALTELGGTFERIIRSFASSGDIAETDLVSRVFGTQQALTNAIREFRQLGFVSEATLSGIADAAGPAGTEIAGLVREYFELQQATQKVSDAQDELNGITQTYADALSPLQNELDAVRSKQQEIRENQELEELGRVLTDPRADADARQLARLEIQEIQLDRQARAIEGERDTAVDAAQDKIDAAKKEEAAQQSKFAVAQSALDQQTKTNALIAEETTLRQRLIDEGIAEQERVLRELEAAQREAEQAERERLAGIERITDAELRYKLASTDTAGQLALMQLELAKVAVGSAEYFDILTQIIGLEERLKKERDSAGAGLFTPLVDVLEAGGDMGEASEGIKALSAALDEAFKVLAGEEGKTVELAPAWQGFADTLGNIGQAAKEVGPLIQSLIDFVTGDGTQLPTGAPGSGGIFGAIYSMVTTAIANLKLLQLPEGAWTSVWAKFREGAQAELQEDILEGDKDGQFLWEQITEVIALIDALAVGDWAKAWELFSEPPRKAIQGIIDLLGNLADAIPDWFRQRMREEGFFVPEQINPNKTRPEGPAGQDVLPGNNFSSFPGIAPNDLLPALATSNMTNSGNTVVQINQQIGMGGDFGGARAGAQEGIRQALINGRLT